MVDEDFIHDALEEVILDIDSRLDKKTTAIQEDIKDLKGTIDRLIQILEKLVQ